jgi:hypothetical protein
MAHYVYSTLSNSVIYTPGEKDSPLHANPVLARILIRGGANVAKRTSTGGLYTPKGVVTEVTDDQMDALKDNVHFKNHVEKGFISSEKKKIKIEKGVADLEPGDKSKPIVPKQMLDIGIKEAEDPHKDKRRNAASLNL